MKKIFTSILMILSIFLFAGAAFGQRVNFSQLCAEPNPIMLTNVGEKSDIAGTYVTWLNTASGGGVIFDDISNDDPPRIVTSPGIEATGFPKISQAGLIVYESYRKGFNDIYLYDLNKETEIQITHDSNTGFNSVRPDIDGNLVSWDDDSNGNVYYCRYSPGAGTLCPIQTIIPDTAFGNAPVQKKPYVSQGRIAYVDKAGYPSGFNADIRVFDTVTGEDKLMISDQLITWIAMDKDDLVWTDEIDATATRLFYCSMAEGDINPVTHECERRLIASDESENIYPNVSDGRVTYSKFWTTEESPYGVATFNIAVMDLKNMKFQEINLTKGATNQHQSAINGPLLTWTKIDPVNGTSQQIMLTCLDPSGVFIRGDANGDQTVDISDATFILGYKFLGASTPNCLDAADTNDDGSIDLSDSVYILQNLFLTGNPFPAPWPGPGLDSTKDDLGCSH